MEKVLQIRVRHEYEQALRYLAYLHDRSATAEANHALWHYITANKPELALAGKPFRKPQPNQNP